MSELVEKMRLVGVVSGVLAFFPILVAFGLMNPYIGPVHTILYILGSVAFSFLIGTSSMVVSITVFAVRSDGQT